MKKIQAILFAALIVCLGTSLGFSQTEAAKTRKSVGGEIIKIDLGKSQIKINAGKGEEFVVSFTTNTSFKKIPPGAVSLEKAVTITPTELGEGDRLLAAGKVDETAKTVEAIQIVIVSARDLSEFSAKNSEEWTRNGVVGEIVSVDAVNKTVSAKIRNKENSETVNLKITEVSQIRRFSNNSVAYKDAVKVALDNVKPSDLFRALIADKGNGVREVREILVGTFQLFSGTITEIDQNSQQLKIKELVSEQVMTVVLNKNTFTRIFSKQFSESINDNLKNKNAALPNDLSQQIKGMPPANISGIKVGDMVLLNTLAQEKPETVTALYLFTGVEPFLLPIQKSLKASKNKSNFKLGLPEGLNNLVLGL